MIHKLLISLLLVECIWVNAFSQDTALIASIDFFTDSVEKNHSLLAVEVEDFRERVIGYFSGDSLLRINIINAHVAVFQDNFFIKDGSLVKVEKAFFKEGESERAGSVIHVKMVEVYRHHYYFSNGKMVYYTLISPQKKEIAQSPEKIMVKYFYYRSILLTKYAEQLKKVGR